ncbi:MAG: HAD-IIIA family hydrolase [Cellvibrionales bacterium TMED148]|nr:hypothetical protein [Porticoccaceae bacterium]RPG89220.1 MAG: HAD-IIIA family hydrolase [Cellvibrionales bacterium TMED148]
MIKKHLIIFDWDGTIENSISLIVASMKKAARAMGLHEPRDNDIRDVIGLDLRNAIQILFPNLELIERDSLISRYRSYYKTAQHGEWRLFKNVEVILRMMKKKKYLLAIATGKSRLGLDRSLQLTGLSGLVDASRTADETVSKPDPQMILELIKELNIAPTNALMVGDSTYDLEMANNASIACIGVTYGVHDKSILTKQSPIGCADDFQEILPLVDRHFADKTKHSLS